jgi:predicted ATPase/class 3 adenylate cyclase
MGLLPTGTVTFLFTDIEGSTKRWEEHEGAMARALARHDAILREAIEVHGGRTFKTVGDAFCAAFTRAPDAVAAALAAQEGLSAQPWTENDEIRIRMAVHTGLAEERDGDYFGPTVNRVARLLAAGYGGQILLSAAAHELVRGRLPSTIAVRDLGEHRLKDLSRPEHVYSVAAPGLPDVFPVLRSLEAYPNNLPVQLTPFIGREQDLDLLASLLIRDDVRLVTLVGPGGSGKTRLAAQAAANLCAAFHDGLFFVSLDSLGDPGLVPSTIAAALGVREVAAQPLLETLQDFLRYKKLLLLLDNFEHLLDAAHVVSTLLASSPQLTVLVTSRSVLGISGERLFEVLPLALPGSRQEFIPGSHRYDLEKLAQFDAIALFIACARAVRPEFSITAENAPAVVEICLRLDGLPLAIELAARRTRLLSPQALLAHLSDRLATLRGGPRDSPARQQTLQNTIDWSYSLLGDEERRLFARLSVFAGGCSIEAAEAVCGIPGDIDVLEGIASLVDKSLLRPLGDEPPRVLMLETMREYAYEQLVASGEAPGLRQQHALFMLAQAERAELEMFGPKQTVWLERLEEDHDNLRLALMWARESSDFAIGLRLANALWRFWQVRGYLSEGYGWMQSILSRHVDRGGQAFSPAEESLRARALMLAGAFATNQDDYNRALELVEESLALYRKLGDQAGVASDLNVLGNIAHYRGDFQRAEALFTESLTLRRQIGNQRDLALTLDNLASVLSERGDADQATSLFEESLAISRSLGDNSGIATVLSNLGEVARGQGLYDQASSLFKEALDHCRALGDEAGIANCLSNLGLIARLQGDDERAGSLYHDALHLCLDVGNKWGVAECLEGLAAVARLRGQPELAAQFFAAASAVRDAIGAPMLPSLQSVYDTDVSTLRATLGDRNFAGAWATGRGLSPEQIKELVVQFEGGAAHAEVH